MRDLAGFAILVVVLLVGAYFAVELVFPLLIKYLLGLILFFLTATWLVWRGRLHPIHLDSLLKPGYALTIGMLSWSIPAAHTMLVYLLTDLDHWLMVFILNATFPVVWTSRLLIVHRRQKAAYTLDGHDIEDLLEVARCRDAALEVKADSLESVAEFRDEPEPWEIAAGAAPRSAVNEPAMLAEVRGGIMTLRESYAGIVKRLGAALSETRSRKVTPPHPLLEDSKSEIEGLEPEFEGVMERARGVLSEAVSDSIAPGWED